MKAIFRSVAAICGIAWILFVGLAPVSAQAQDLLAGVPVLIATDKAGEADNWAPEVSFDKPGRYAFRLRANFEVKELPATPVLALKKPEYQGEWTLNGQPLAGPDKEMIYTELEGVPTSALKVGANVLEARFVIRVMLIEGKLRPKSLGKLKLELTPGDIKKFDIRTGPVLGAAGYDYFTVGCRTRMPATVTLHCDGRTWASKPGVIHRLRADGLKEGQSYEYKLTAAAVAGGAAASSKSWKVTTLSSKGPWTFAALGDARSNPKLWGAITGEVRKFKPSFVLHTGDIIGNGQDYDGWDKQFAATAEEFLATVPCFYAFGNHEQNVPMIYQMFGFPQDDRSSYTQTIGPVQIFGMNRFEDWKKGSPNLVRMEKELAASTSPFIFAFSHYPAWSSGAHGNDKLGIEVHFPIFDKHRVTALIAGHDHCYERSEPGGATMLITGGGGAPLYGPVKAKKNPHSKIYRTEYNFLVFETDGQKCTMTAWMYGDAKTPDSQRKLVEADRRVWEPRK